MRRAASRLKTECKHHQKVIAHSEAPYLESNPRRHDVPSHQGKSNCTRNPSSCETTANWREGVPSCPSQNSLSQVKQKTRLLIQEIMTIVSVYASTYHRAFIGMTIHRCSFLSVPVFLRSKLQCCQSSSALPELIDPDSDATRVLGLCTRNSI